MSNHQIFFFLSSGDNARQKIRAKITDTDIEGDEDNVNDTVNSQDVEGNDLQHGDSSDEGIQDDGNKESNEFTSDFEAMLARKREEK